MSLCTSNKVKVYFSGYLNLTKCVYGHTFEIIDLYKGLISKLEDFNLNNNLCFYNIFRLDWLLLLMVL